MAKSILSKTTYESFHCISWSNTATKTFWNICSGIKVNSRGKTLKTILKTGLGCYQAKSTIKGEDIGVIAYKIRQGENYPVNDLITEKVLEELKTKCEAAGLPMKYDKAWKVSRDEAGNEIGREFWGYAFHVSVAHIIDIEQVRQKKKLQEK